MYFVYILTNPSRSVLYTGVTNNLSRRCWEHYDNRGADKTFSGRYSCFNLVYFEVYNAIKPAIAREKEIKKWRREKKILLIQGMNPDMKFLNDEFVE